MMKSPTKVISKITSKNQVTIPQSIREMLDVGSNDSIQWTIHSDGTISVENANDNLWDVVKEQEKTYGNVSTPEIDWGQDRESEDL